jgi:Protein of unknown function (DUF2567)
VNEPGAEQQPEPTPFPPGPPGPPAIYPPTPGPPAVYPPPPGPPGRSAASGPWATRADLIFGGIAVGVLAVLGVAAGALWSAISPPSGGVVVSSTVVIPNENEGFVAGDARFMIITAVIGLLAGSIGWALRSYRGPVAVAALAIGGTLGATITALVGHTLSSGRTTGVLFSSIRLPLTLHAHSLIAIEGGLALLAYLVGTLFVAPDDLGRPGPQSVGAGDDPQGLGGDGDRPGVAQDGQFAAQQGDLGR